MLVFTAIRAVVTLLRGQNSINPLTVALTIILYLLVLWIAKMTETFLGVVTIAAVKLWLPFVHKSQLSTVDDRRSGTSGVRLRVGPGRQAGGFETWPSF